MRSLKTLKLSENPISNVSVESLNGLWNLREVHLDNMKLSSLDVIGFFAALPGLRFDTPDFRHDASANIYL